MPLEGMKGGAGMFGVVRKSAWRRWCLSWDLKNDLELAEYKVWGAGVFQALFCRKWIVQFEFMIMVQSFSWCHRDRAYS